MTTRIEFTPLGGEDCYCYLLVLDRFRLLLDCGWNSDFNISLLNSLAKVAPAIDAVLLSHPDISHLGALPYAIGKLGLDCPVYGTIPVFKMGQMFMYDAWKSKSDNEGFDLFSLDDVDTAFDKVVQLKYSEHFRLGKTGQEKDIVITPHCSGRILGGTVWQISKETEEIIYAVDWNHRKERHLNGTVLEKLERPSLLITDAFNALSTQPSRKIREKNLVDTIMSTLRSGGNVLIPVDTAGRSLELSLLLEQHWIDHRLGIYGLALLNNMSYNTIEFAKSQLEWMGDAITKNFDNTRENPYSFKYLKTVHTIEEVESLPSPVCVLASMSDLTSGFSKDLFLKWCSNSKHCVIFTDRGFPGTPAYKLIAGDAMNSPEPTISMPIWTRVPLEGDELVSYEERQEMNREEERKREERKRLEQLARDAISNQDVILMCADMDDQAAIDLDATAKNPFTDNYDATPEDFMKLGLKFPMFPSHERTLLFDSFGQILSVHDILSPKRVNVSSAITVSEYDPLEASSCGLNEESPVYHDQRSAHEKPTKCISELRRVSIHCNMKYIDFEGRSDGKSIRSILSLVEPRRVVTVRAVQEAHEAIASWCRLQLWHCLSSENSVFSPSVGETIDLSSNASAFSISLKEALFKDAPFQKAGDYELLWIDGELLYLPSNDNFSFSPAPPITSRYRSHRRIIFHPYQGDIQKDPRRKYKQDRRTCGGYWNGGDNSGDHNAVFVGDVKLSEFRQILIKNGFQVRFDRGVLLCNDMVVVRKEGRQVLVDGAMCEDYFKVRELLYGQYIEL